MSLESRHFDGGVMPKICLRCAWDMPETYLRYDWNKSLSRAVLCLFDKQMRYAWDIVKTQP